jgi:aminoglycoside/choline kinase family phosphotransferase
VKALPETDISVPASEVEITKEWLQAVLAGTFPNTIFAELEGKRIGEEYGFASLIIRCQWQDEDKPQSVIVKMWDTDNKAGIQEVLFYKTFKDAGTRIPICFYSKADEDKRKAVLVLEDLSDVIQGDVLEKLDMEREKGVAHSLARLHATWMEHPKLTELSWISDMSNWSPGSDWFHSRRALFLERFPNHLNKKALSVLDRIEFAPHVANERLKNSPVTLLHGDFHFDNIVFEKRIEPVLLDWSHPVKGAPAHNLAQLLFMMISLENFDQVLDHYLDEFGKISKKPLERAEFEKQLGGAFLRHFSASTCGVARWQPSLPRAIEVLERGIEQINEVTAFWRKRDPGLFSFISE